MRFLFFDASGAVLFERSDMESAETVHEEMSLQATFPFDGQKEITRGMRVGYEDALGVYQVFEVRKVRTLEPDHYQQITAEHIAISELTDEFCKQAEINNQTAGAVLTTLLNGTGWALGTSTASNTSSCDLQTGDVWSATRTIQQNWNVYILPRITVGNTGITGKYLDVVPAGGTWRGFRISLDKNANDIGVTWDDSKLKTALYAYGQAKNGTPLTFKDTAWPQTADHPAKPQGQEYLEDPTATANFGRNGRPRFGYYQNASITNATTLLEKTWETLKNINVPDVTIDSTVIDLHRFGLVDVPIRLHDTALVEIKGTGVVLQKEIIQYTEDLLNVNNSRLTIGTYIPNIIYINRETARRGGGGRGAGGQTLLEYTTENNTVQIKTDSNGLNSLCVGTGAQLNPDGSLVVDPITGKPVFIDTGDNMWSQITQNKTNITLKVSKGDVATQLAVECGNVTITGGNLVVDGYVTSAGLASDIAALGNVHIDHLYIDTQLDVTGQAFFDEGLSATGSIYTEGTVVIGETDLADAVYSFGTPTASGGQISIPWTKVDGTAGTPINFNIADTAYYQSHVGIQTLALNGPISQPYQEGEYKGELTAGRYYQAVATPKSGSAQKFFFKTPAGGSAYTEYIVTRTWASYTPGTTYSTRRMTIKARGKKTDGTWEDLASSTFTVTGSYQAAEAGGHELIISSY